MVGAVLFFILGVCAAAIGFQVFQRADTVMQEIAGLLFGLISAILLVGGFLLSEIRGLAKHAKVASDEMRKINLQLADEMSTKAPPSHPLGQATVKDK